MQLPEEDSNFSLRIREIKRLTTLWMKHEAMGIIDPIWQDKYWEHTIRDEKDLQTHFNCIHHNPIKHGLMETCDGWKWSIFRDYHHDNNYEFQIIDPDLVNKHQGDFGQ